jgi:hypothetical protein
MATLSKKLSKRVTSIHCQEDDPCSWAVFIDGKVYKMNLIRQEIRRFRKQATTELMRREAYLP